MIGPGGVASWSPDGKLIVCQSNDTPHGILVMNRDGSGREAILDHNWSPRWSPVGDRIAAAKVDGTGITLIDLATGGERDVFSGPYSLRHGFSISPNGKHICFASTSTPGLGLATLDDSSQAKISWPVNRGSHIILLGRPTANASSSLGGRPSKTLSSSMCLTSPPTSRPNCSPVRIPLATT